MPLSDTTRAAAERLVRRYPVARSALLPLLHLVQSDQGYVTDEGIAFCAETVGLTKAEVGAVATFYTMFKREPVGDYLVSVCTNPTCKIAGAQDVYERFQEKLGGHHDPETGVSVEHAECLGICDAAPVIQVNYEMYGPLPGDQIDALLEGCRKGEPPASNWSGEVPRTFKEVEWDLSGADDGIDDQLIAAARAQVRSEVPPAYRTGETDLPVTHPGGDPQGIGGELFREQAAAVATTSDATRVSDSGAADELADAPTEGERSGVAEERAEQASGDGTGATPSVSDQPATEGTGDEPAEQSGETVDATDESQVGTKVGDERDPDPDEMPAVQQDDTTDRAAPDLQDDQAKSAAEGETSQLDDDEEA